MLLLLLSGGSAVCQYVMRGSAFTEFTTRDDATSGDVAGEVFPGMPWMPTGGSGFTARAAAMTAFNERADAEGSGMVCDT